MAKKHNWDKKMTWQQFGNIRKSTRSSLYHSAVKDRVSTTKKRVKTYSSYSGENYSENASFNIMKDLSRQIKTEVNKRLREFEKHDVAYGKEYNYMMYFLQTQFGTNRVPSNTAIKNNPSDMFDIIEHGLRFLQNTQGGWKSKREAEKWIYKNWGEGGDKSKKSRATGNILFKDMSFRQSRDFLKFLGNEQVSATIDSFGESDQVVEMLWDAYKQQGSEMFAIAEKTLAEFLATEKEKNTGIKIDKYVTFDEAMERIGIKVEDYYNRKATS